MVRITALQTEGQAVYQRGETYYHWITFRNSAKALYDPSTATDISIYDPCSSATVSSQAMTRDSVGVYYYPYILPADAPYGEYNVEVTVTDGADKFTFTSQFYVLPWKAVSQIRALSGIDNKKSISNNDIARVIWEAYGEALDDVFEDWHRESPLCNPDTGAWIDGSNTVFATQHSPIADRNGDGVVNGYMEASCGTDVSGWWKDSDGACHKLKITVNEAHCGNLTITQLDGTALPGNACWVKLDYSTEWRTYTERLFRLAVAYLATYKCIIRFTSADRATLADIDSNKESIMLAKSNYMLKEYKKVMRKISRPQISGAMLPGGEQKP